MTQSSSLSLKQRISYLTEFIPLFEAPDYCFGKWIEGVKTDDGYTIGYCEYSEEAGLFIDAVYEHELVLMDFNWPEWSLNREAEQLRDCPEILASASLDQVMQLFTTVIRQDRFCDGVIADAFNSGLLLNILRRMAVLSGEMTE